jgi:hypothetical protein
MKSAVLALLALFVLFGAAFAQSNICLLTDNNAKNVIGQPEFFLNSAGDTNAGLNGPNSIRVDPASGKIFVTEYSGSFVSRFPAGSLNVNGASAESFFGGLNATNATQSSLNQPYDAEISSTGNMYVSDQNNHRVIRFDTVATAANFPNAAQVLGQASFTTNALGTGTQNMAFPTGLALSASGTLWVSDSGNHRVLFFNNAGSKANGAAADGAFGTNGQPGSSNTQFLFPDAIDVDIRGNLYVADTGNNRVLIFRNASTKASPFAADVVLGQTGFGLNTNGTGQNRMSGPFGVFSDAGTDWLYVSDGYNNRILVFFNASGATNGANANVVVGQSGSFATNIAGSGPGNLAIPAGLHVDRNFTNSLMVADFANNRGLRYCADLSPSISLTNSLSASLNASVSGSTSLSGSISLSGSGSGSGTLSDSITRSLSDSWTRTGPPTGTRSISRSPTQTATPSSRPTVANGVCVRCLGLLCGSINLLRFTCETILGGTFTTDGEYACCQTSATTFSFEWKVKGVDCNTKKKRKMNRFCAGLQGTAVCAPSTATNTSTFTCSK